MPEVTSGSPWTDEQEAALVDSYFRMLDADLRNESFSKSAEKARVSRLIGRDANDRKYQNVSAVLHELGMVTVSGYKPQRNSKASLASAVAKHLATHPEIGVLAESSQLEDQSLVPDFVWDLHLTDAPVIEVEFGVRSPSFIPRKVDFVALDARNRSRGKAGEMAVVEFERKRLDRADRPDLAAKVEHIAETAGDGAGFDVLSYEADGAERYIEVKTTARGIAFPFHVSRNEVDFSRECSNQFQLYRLYNFNRRDERGFYTLPGALDETCMLSPTQFSARPRAS